MCLSWTEWLGKRCSSNKRSSLEFSKSVRLWWACKSFPSEIHSRVFSTLSGTVNMCFKFSIATAYWEWITCSSLTLFTLSHKLGSGIIASSISWSLNFNWNLSYNTNNWLNIWFSYCKRISLKSFSADCNCCNPLRTPSSWLWTAVFNIASTDAFFRVTLRLYCSTFREK